MEEGGETKAVANVPAPGSSESNGTGHKEQAKTSPEQEQEQDHGKRGAAERNKKSDEADEGSEGDEATPLFEASPVVAGKRQRKKAKNLLEELSKEAMEKPAKKEVQEQGSGEPLGDNPIVEDFLSKRKAEQLTELHRFLYGKPGTRTTRKKQIREFSGFPESLPEITRERRREALGRKPVKVLKDMCHGLDILFSGTKKEEILDSVMEWVKKPMPSGASVRSKSKKKKKSTTPKKKKPATPKKRAEAKDKGKGATAAATAQPLSAFQLFLKDAKPQYQRDNPEASILEMTKSLRTQWEGMSDEERQLYEDAAAIERRNIEEASAVAKRKAGSPAKRKKSKAATASAVSKKKKGKASTTRASTSAGKRRAISMDTVVSDDSDMEEPEEEEEEEEEGEPEAKKVKSAVPSEEELRNAVFTTLRDTDLSKMTKKKVKAAIAGQYPGVDLSDKASVIVSAINDFVHEQSS